MRCAWQELLGILPRWLSLEVDRHGKESLQELRLRLGQPAELVCGIKRNYTLGKVSREDLNFVVNAASQYSPWAATTISRGYITAKGGHRIGLCGDVVMKNGECDGIRTVRSVNIRVARDFPGLAEKAASLPGSVLILGAPGWGKTTLLRDLIRQYAKKETVCVVDERRELFPDGLNWADRVDILAGCPKPEGLDRLLRTMGPECIAVDEITSESDCDALLRAAWCGVRLLATAHAGSEKDLMTRPIYQKLVNSRIFDHILVLNRDKSWREERMIP